jgi:hypothetical protein
MTRARDIRTAALLFAAAIVLIAACSPKPTPPPPPPVALAPIEVVGVGDLEQGATSDEALVIRVTELEADSIAVGPGSFDLVLADSAGGLDTVVFTETAELTAPGSLGVTARLVRGNVLTVEIVDSDTFNVEQVTIRGLALSAAASTPPGPLTLTVDGCAGSLAGCTANDLLGSPGTIVARL